MGTVRTIPQMTLDEFCDWVLTQDRKYEYYKGEVLDVYAMAGAKAAHNAVTLNVGSALNAALRGKPCCPFVADMMLRLPEHNVGYYPDVRDGEQWLLLAPQDVLDLQSIGVSMARADVFADVVANT